MVSGEERNDDDDQHKKWNEVMVWRDNFIQVIVFRQTKPRVGAFVHGNVGGSLLDALCNWSVWRSHDGEADDDNEDDDDHDDDDDDDDNDDDQKVAMIITTTIIWRVRVEFVVGSLPCAEKFFCG